MPIHFWLIRANYPTQSAEKRKKSGGGDTEDAEAAAAALPQPQSLKAESYTPPDPGPYPQDKPPENSVRFTPVQVSLVNSLSNLLYQGPSPAAAVG